MAPTSRTPSSRADHPLHTTQNTEQAVVLHPSTGNVDNVETCDNDDYHHPSVMTSCDDNAVDTSPAIGSLDHWKDRIETLSWPVLLLRDWFATKLQAAPRHRANYILDENNDEERKRRLHAFICEAVLDEVNKDGNSLQIHPPSLTHSAQSPLETTTSHAPKKKQTRVPQCCSVCHHYRYKGTFGKFHTSPIEYRYAKKNQNETNPICKVPESYRGKILNKKIPLIDKKIRRKLKTDHGSVEKFIAKVNDGGVENKHEYGCFFCLSQTNHPDDETSSQPQP